MCCAPSAVRDAMCLLTAVSVDDPSDGRRSCSATPIPYKQRVARNAGEASLHDTWLRHLQASLTSTPMKVCSCFDSPFRGNCTLRAGYGICKDKCRVECGGGRDRWEPWWFRLHATRHRGRCLLFEGSESRLNVHSAHGAACVCFSGI